MFRLPCRVCCFQYGQPPPGAAFNSASRYSISLRGNSVTNRSTNEPGLDVHRIAVIGSGPRGLSVVERLAARLAGGECTGPVEIQLIDDVEVGTGRVWRTDQPEWFLMNTVAGEVSAFSGSSDGGPARPGAGPSLAEWWATQDPAHAGVNTYAPRAVHGRYMHFVLETAERCLPPHARLRRVHDRVVSLRHEAGRQRLRLAGGGDLLADRVVLVTGHTRPELTGLQRRLSDFAAAHEGVRYIRGDSAADMPLEEIPAGSGVGVIGLGLSFYDVMAALTLGRGGKFVPEGEHGLRYEPSGREPVLVAGSRSGMPLLARGRNQKHFNARYRTRLFTVDRVRGDRPPGTLDFAAQAMPWLMAEVQLVHYATALRLRHGTEAAERFTEQVCAAAGETPPDVPGIAAAHGVGDLAPLDLDAIARPFEKKRYADHAAFEADLLAAVADDLAHAEQGNVDSPVKAGLDVLRDTRAVVRELVDFAGLTPQSHRTDFLGWFVPRVSFLAAGPPLVRLRQVTALLKAGVLRIPGPHTRFEGCPRTGRFVVDSPQVAGSRQSVETVIDARVPTPDLRLDPSGLIRLLVEDGRLCSYVNGAGPGAFDTGGVAVTRSPYHPLDRDGRPDTGTYVLGIPTEHTRWFMQGGSSRPGFWTDFVRDADAIAEDALRAASAAPAPARAAALTAGVR